MKIDVAKIVAEVAENAAKKAANILKYVEVVNALEAEGVNIGRIGRFDVEYLSEIRVQRHELSKVRNVVGRLSMTGKDAAYDFNTTNEIVVSLKPMNTDFPVKFTYRAKFRKGGKCKVITQTYTPSESVSLVCSK